MSHAWNVFGKKFGRAVVYVSQSKCIYENLAFEEWLLRNFNIERNGEVLLLWRLGINITIICSFGVFSFLYVGIVFLKLQIKSDSACLSVDPNSAEEVVVQLIRTAGCRRITLLWSSVLFRPRQVQIIILLGTTL